MTYLVTAAVHAEHGSERDTGDQSKQDGQTIGDGQEDAEAKLLLEGRCETPEDDEHVEHADEHAVVDARLAVLLSGDDIADQGEGEENEEELCAAQSSLDE